MPQIRTPLFLRARGTTVGDLHRELSVVIGPVASDELDNEVYGETTQEAVFAFQDQVGLKTTGVVDAPTGALLTATATFAVDGNTQSMRDNLRQAVNASPSTPALAYELTRYEILAGNYGEARNIFSNLLIDDASLPEMNETVGGILADPSGQVRFKPEIPYPGNFYTYQNKYLDQSDITRMLNDLRELDPRVVDGPSGSILERRGEDLISATQAVFRAINHWQQGIHYIETQQYQLAILELDACQNQVLRYFADYYQVSLGKGSRNSKLIRLIRYIKANGWSWLWSVFNWRRSLLSLVQLERTDWKKPPLVFQTAKEFIDLFLQVKSEFDQEGNIASRQTRVDVPLITLAFIFVPLARGEANQMRRHFEGAITQFEWLLKPIRTDDNPNSPQIHIACDFIEIPFVSLRLGQVLLAKAEARYKARRLGQARNSYQNVIDLFDGAGSYKTDVEGGVTTMQNEVNTLLTKSFHSLVANNPGNVALTKTEREQFSRLGKNIPIATIEAETKALPGLDRRSGPHEPLLKFTDTNGTSNPLVFALVTEARARLLQIENGFNYLGYSDDYIPPWRFQFLLERARYFAEHAKNAQREYLNFLSNAQQEQFQELTAAQAVELEKSNIRVENARVETARLEVEAAKESNELAKLTSANAQDRANRYFDMSMKIETLSAQSFVGSFLSGVGGAASGGIGGLFSYAGGLMTEHAQLGIAAEQRQFELSSLNLAALEAAKAAEVSQAQLDVASQSLVVAGLQRIAALIRHEFAVQSLNYLQNRTLNSELWYRLSTLIRSVADTYMRYAVELAFLAEQAYEFEVDKQINVIRFDYDVSEIGSLLAADFLLRDLDTLEQDLIVNQRIRQQQVKYVVSFARDYPEALQELRDSESTIFTLRLEQLERRFPGIFKLRIGAVDVTPVALMDPTRFSLELTYLGSSQVRLKAQPDTPFGTTSPSPLNQNDVDGLVDASGNAINAWLSNLSDTYPVKIRVTGPETNVYSGLTRQDISSVFPFISTSQRNAFEGLGASASWRIDMSMKENKVVPGTLADVLITFTLYGYYDTDLRTAIDTVPPQAQILTQFLSARERFADAFFEFNQSGQMNWAITDDVLSIDEPARVLRNLGVLLIPAARRSNFGRIMATYRVDLRIPDQGAIEILTPIPELDFSINGLGVTANVQGLQPMTTVSWDFGDDTGFGAFNNHTYQRPGKYQVTLRLVDNQRLFEYTADIFVSRDQSLTLASPLTVFPTLSMGDNTINAAGTRQLDATLSDTSSTTAIWQIQGRALQRGASTQFDLEPGTYSMLVVVIRDLTARIFSRQRFIDNATVNIHGLRISTNRTFDDSGETTGNNGNEFTDHLFPLRADNTRPVLSPVDDWVVQLLASDNPALLGITPNDNIRLAAEELENMILIVNYETRK